MDKIVSDLVSTLGSFEPGFIWGLIVIGLVGPLFFVAGLIAAIAVPAILNKSNENLNFTRKAIVGVQREMLAEIRSLRMELVASRNAPSPAYAPQEYAPAAPVYEVQQAPQPTAIDAAAAAQAAAVGAEESGYPLLIMDDDTSILFLLGKMCRTLGYLPVTAKSGVQALRAFDAARAEGKPLQVGIFDLTVPGGMGGRELLKHILSRDPAFKAIACTGYLQEELRIELTQEGFIDVLGKPFRIEELHEMLNTHLSVAAA